MVHRISLALLSFTCVTSSARANPSPPGIPIIHVGDAAMSGAELQPYDNVWLVTLHYNDGRVVERGLSTDHVRFVDLNGKHYLNRIESETDVINVPGQPPSSSSSLTFNIFDPATMAPLHGE